MDSLWNILGTPENRNKYAPTEVFSVAKELE